MTGKTYVLTKSDVTASVTGTVTYVSATQITISVAATWTENGSTLEILDSQPHGLLMDLTGVALNEGEWDFNPEDNSELRGQPVASNPNGSTQGGTGGQDPTGSGGTGGRDCVLDEAIVTVRGRARTGWICRAVDAVRSWFGLPSLGAYRLETRQAIEVEHTDYLWNGLGTEAEDFNEIAWIAVTYVGRLREVRTATKMLPCTDYHRITDGPRSFRCGVSVGTLSQGTNVLISDQYSVRVEPVSSVTRRTGRFRVVSFGLKHTKKLTGNLLVVNDFVSHNLKREPVGPGDILTIN
jgi:hypothetical protein